MKKKFEALKPSLRSDMVFNELKDAIFNGELKPGEVLRELHIANGLGVSQSTVREALLQLEQSGLIEKNPHRGSRVIKKSEKEIADLVLIRFQLEELAAIQASFLMSDKDFTHLNSLTKKINVAMSNNKYFDLTQNDLEFHRYIWKKSGNQQLEKLLEQVTVPIFASVGILRSREKHELTRVVNSHESLANALKSKDKARIKKYYRKDLKESYGIVL